MSGKYWENHFTDKLLKCDFEPISGWECLFFHRRLKLILSVYVDDLKLVGKHESVKEGWGLITKSGLVLDPPTPLGDYLGCGQFLVNVPPAEAQRRLEHISQLLDGIDDPQHVKTGKQVKAIRCNMFGFFRQCVQAYCDLVTIKPETLRNVATPGMDDHLLKPTGFEQTGNLSLDTAKVIMKALYGARLVRYERLWPICSSAREASK